MPGTFRGVRDSHGAWQSAGDGQCSNGSFSHHTRSGSVDSLDSNSGSSVSSTGHARQLSGESTEFIPTRTVAKVPTLPAHNPLQFVKVQTSPLCRKAEQQLKLTKTVKITREKLKEEEEEWQLNLDDWKSRRRKLSEKVIQRQEEMRQIEAEEQMRQLQTQKKAKTFSEMIEERSQRKKSYKLPLYYEDDSRASGTSETEEQGSSSADIQHLNTRSDASDVTSEAESVPESLDSDRVCEQDNDILQEQVPFHQVSSYRLESSANEFENQKIEPHEENYTHLHPLSESVSKMEHSSAEPSDIEALPGEFEPVSSEEDGGCCLGIGNNDSGLESLCGSHRAGGDPDSASDFSQDSCSGLDKSALEVECEKETENYRLDVDERNKVCADFGNSVYSSKLGDREDSSLTIQIKPGGDTKSFGFTLKGGSDQGLPVLVESVVAGSPSDLAGLKVGDEVLAINEETTSGCSHAALVFAVKQAIYTEQLNMIISRQSFTANPEGDATHQHEKKQPPKPTKRGSAFAQKIAMFNTSSSEGSTSVHMRKTQRAQELKGDSLVLRRRSAFENSSLNTEQTKTNRRSLSLLQDAKCTEKASSNDRRHSVGFTNESENMTSEEATFITKKPPPPPIPVKPKLLQKLSSELKELSHVPVQYSAVTEFSTISPSSDSLDRNDLVHSEQLMPPCIDELCTESITNNDTNKYFQDDELGELVSCDHSPYTHIESNSSAYNELQKDEQFEILANDKNFEMPECSQWNIMADESINSQTQYLQKCKYPVIDEEKELNTDRLSNNLNNFPEAVISLDSHGEFYDDQVHIVPVEENLFKYDERIFAEENIPDVEIQNMLLPETSVDSIESNEVHCSDFQEDSVNACEMRTDIEGTESANLLEDSRDDGSPDFIGPDEAYNDEVVSEEIISEFSEDNITVLEMQREDLDKSENYLSDLENDSETERNLDDEGTPLPPVDLESPSHDTELCEGYPSGDAGQSQDDALEFSKETNEEVEQIVTHFNDTDVSNMPLEYQIEGLCDGMGQQFQLEDEYLVEPPGQDEADVVYLDGNELLLDDLDMPCDLEPPKEKPPPPPPLDVEVNKETSENKTPTFMRVNSTKRIKKEIKKRRSDFLGLDPSAADDVDIILPRPPQMEEILKSEQELAREQRQWLENRLSLPDKCMFSNMSTDINEGTNSELCVDVEDGGESDVFSSTPNEEKLLMEVGLSDLQQPTDYEFNWPSGKKQEVMEIPVSDNEFGSKEEEPKAELPQAEKPSDPSPHAITRQNIFSLGAAPKAKIMDSDKWIRQNDKASPRKQPPDSLFFDSSYATQQKARTPDSYEYSLHFSPERKQIHNRYSIASLSSHYPDVTVRTWREREHFSQRKPRSCTNPDLVSVSSSIDSVKHDRSHSEPVENYYSESIRHSASSDNIQRLHSPSVSERKICVSSKNKCAHCSEELVHGAAMGIEALQLYYHIQCFTCCACKAELGNGVHGTDVQVWNRNLYCQTCFSCIDVNSGTKI